MGILDYLILDQVKNHLKLLRDIQNGYQQLNLMTKISIYSFQAVMIKILKYGI